MSIFTRLESFFGFVSGFFLKSWSWEVIGFGKLYFKMFLDKMKKKLYLIWIFKIVF